MIGYFYLFQHAFKMLIGVIRPHGELRAADVLSLTEQKNVRSFRALQNGRRFLHAMVYKVNDEAE